MRFSPCLRCFFFYIPNHVTDFLPINLKSDNVPPAVYFKYQFFSFLLSLSKLFWDVLPPLCHSNSQWVKVFLVMVKCQDLNIYKWDLQVIALCCCIHTLHSILTLKELGLYILSTVLVEFCYYINSLLLGELTFTFGFTFVHSNTHPHKICNGINTQKAQCDTISLGLLSQCSLVKCVCFNNTSKLISVYKSRISCWVFSHFDLILQTCR